MDHESFMKLDLLTLKFSGDSSNLETPFQRENFRVSLPHNRAAMLVGIFFYSFFGILDALLMPEKKSTIWLIRFAIIDPILIGTFLLSFSKYFERYVNPLMTCVSILAGGGIICMTVIAPPPVNYSYYAGLLLVFMWTYAFVRIPFLWASFAGWVVVILYEIAAVWISPTPLVVLLNNNFFFISANVMGMIACYSLEYYARRDFFLTRQIEVERQKITRVNRELENQTLEYQRVNRALEQEINERKRTEEAFRNSEKRFRHVTENIGEVIWEFDVEGMFAYCSPAAERIVGYTPDELVGKKHFYDFIAADERESMKQAMLEQIRSKQLFHNLVVQGLHRNGEIVILEISGLPILDEKGNLCGYRGAVRNITDRKLVEKTLQESEALYRTALERSNDGVVIVRDGRYVYVNQKFLDNLGRSREEMMDKAVGEYIHPDDRVTVMDYLSKYRQGLPTPSHMETRVFKPDGTILYFDISLAEVTYKGIKSVLGYLRDITGRKREEEERYRYEKIHGVLEMAGTVCHELNQPMQIISGYSEMLIRDISENDPIHAKLYKINRQIQRMSTITKKLMRIENFETEDYAGFSRIININKRSAKDPK